MSAQLISRGRPMSERRPLNLQDLTNKTGMDVRKTSLGRSEDDYIPVPTRI